MSDNEFYTRFRQKMQDMHSDAPIEMFSSFDKTVKTLTAMVSFYYMYKKRKSGWIVQDAIKVLGLEPLNFIYYPAAICTGMGMVAYMGMVVGALLMTRMEMDLDEIDKLGNYKIKMGRYKREGTYSYQEAEEICRKYKIKPLPELQESQHRKIPCQ